MEQIKSHCIDSALKMHFWLFPLLLWKLPPCKQQSPVTSNSAALSTCEPCSSFFQTGTQELLARADAVSGC